MNETFEEFEARVSRANQSWINAQIIPQDLPKFCLNRAAYFKKQLECDLDDHLTRVWLKTSFNRWTRFYNMLIKEKK